MGARAANALIGFWMFLSTFLWPHAPAQRLTGWIVGTAAVTGAMAGLMSRTWGRYVNAALGGWLLVSGLFLPRLRPATFWNDMLVGFGLVLFSMMSGPGFGRHVPPAP
jgi:hypothetical protein